MLKIYNVYRGRLYSLRVQFDEDKKWYYCKKHQAFGNKSMVLASKYPTSKLKALKININKAEKKLKKAWNLFTNSY